MPERGVAGARPTEVTVKTSEMARGPALSLRPPPGLQRLKAPSFFKKKKKKPAGSSQATVHEGVPGLASNGDHCPDLGDRGPGSRERA